jgi:DNA invertase Pin-like site-specific DNA recombinase
MLGTFARRCELDREIAELRAHVERQQAKGAPTRTRYSQEFRQRVLALVRERQAQGLSIRGVARAVGLKETTVQRWLQAGPQNAGLRQVVLEAEPTTSNRFDRLVVFAGPLRIEGLDLASLSELVRRLG